MPSVTQIKIGKHRTGIVGLKEALEEVASETIHPSEEQIAVLLIKKLSRKNYIPSIVINLYETAFLREFKKFKGEPVPESPLEDIEIKVLGA
jgi:hypothetical protein